MTHRKLHNTNVTADQVAHQLLLNGKPPYKKCYKSHLQQQGDTESTWLFNSKEIQAATNFLKDDKAALMTFAQDRLNILGRLLEIGYSRCSTTV